MKNTISIAVEKKLAVLRNCPEWRAFKARWDGRIPRQGSKDFDDYRKDALHTQEALQKVFGAWV